ncbi:Uu.00g059020.m01.CDS01 [Anthostomella pinea]|uniref:Uu.00g059020.m01.CDS01 n=1 Tax=Anthostomella pinea TaxID=933095 RepID=A0AAI8VT63_9PEZI|nr:Uu.00g059020.m01.CDS01 [Anthostomella pinea]
MPSKSKKNPEIARAKRMQRQKDLGRMLKRAQKYLGLRPRAAYSSGPLDSSAPWEVSMPVPFKTKASVRFVCVDVEAYERNTNVVTEIGFAILDTEDTMDVPPGENGENWFPLIKAHHLRIDEYSYMVNHDFVKGCPGSFNFGSSEFVALTEVSKVIGTIIGDNHSDDRRPVIMVGHDIKTDLKYLQKVGYNPWRVQHISDEVDTKSMFQRMERNPNGRGLETVCAEMGLSGRNYHNGGNDAVYTLRAMITMTVKRMVDGSDRKVDAQPGEDEWSDGEMDDGGAPERSAEPVKPAAQQSGNKRMVPNVWL